MASALKPDIYWHYLGKLRTLLEDAACESCTQAVVDILRSPPPGRTYLCVPVSEPAVFQEAVTRAFKAASMSVYTTTVEGCRHVSQLSTTYEDNEAVYRLSTYAGAAERFAAHLRSNIFMNRVFGKSDKRSTAEVLLVFPSESRYRSSSGAPDPAEECRRMMQMAQERGHRAEVLPEPGLELDAALHIIKTTPSKILDGSHPWERSLEERIEEGAQSSPAWYLIRAAWRALKSEARPEVFSLRAFEARFESLDPSIATAYPWEAIFDLWREVLLGFESDREYAGRWYERVYSRGDGWVSLDDVHEIWLYESSVYVLHCEIDPACLSYPVAYYGSRWMHRRMALASMFGGGGTSGGPSPDFSWD